MEDMDTKVDYHTATMNMGNLFEEYKAYIVDSTAH